MLTSESERAYVVNVREEKALACPADGKQRSRYYGDSTSIAPRVWSGGLLI